MLGGGASKHRGSVHSSSSAAPGLIPSVSKKLMLLGLLTACCLEISGQQKLENVDQTHLVLIWWQVSTTKLALCPTSIYFEKVHGRLEL